MGKGLTLDFRFGGNGTDYRGTGWSEPESGGTWMLGQQSLMLLPRPVTRGDYRLELDVGSITGPSHPSQRLSVSVNGEVLAEFVLLDDALEHCVLPWSVIGREPGLTLVLSHPDAWRPSELTGGEGDQRELSVFLRSARLSVYEAAPASGPDAAAPMAEVPVRPMPAPFVPVALTPVTLPTAPPKASTSPAPIPAAPATPARAAQTPAAAPPAVSPPTVPVSPASRPAAPAPVQEDRLPWWKKLLG